MRTPAEHRYYQEHVRPLLAPGGEPLAEQPLAARIQLMRHAEALINPICWPEPFGLVMIEALAAGTPVLAYPNSAAPEIIQHAVTGYLCHGEQEMTRAVTQLPAIQRAACRAAAEQRFTLARMAAGHERLYHRLLTGQPLTGLAASGRLVRASA
jgi:glycosyltransferase involved in cell wall biosynthesis